MIFKKWLYSVLRLKDCHICNNVILKNDKKCRYCDALQGVS